MILAQLKGNKFIINLYIIIIAVFTMDGQYHFSINRYKHLKHQNKIESYFFKRKSLQAHTNQDPGGAI